jgi:DNA-binding transcriptional regulator YdaS (Cro superfamily)
MFFNGAPLSLLEVTDYQPDRLLDKLSKQLKAGNDRKLARLLEISPSTISKIRRKVIAISAKHLLSIHDTSGIAIKELRKMMGDKRKFFD